MHVTSRFCFSTSAVCVAGAKWGRLSEGVGGLRAGMGVKRVEQGGGER